MLAIMEMKKLFEFTDLQHKALMELNAKDRVVLIANPADSLPVDMIPVVSQIKARLEICKLPSNGSPFEKGFLYGSLALSAGKEPVIILSEEPKPANLPANCSWNEGFGLKPKKRTTAKQAETGAPAEKPSTVKKEKTVKPAERALSEGQMVLQWDNGDSKVLSSPLLAEALPLIKGNEEKFMKCLTECSDGEIGYKTMLETYLGKPGGEIWELTHKQFKKLRKLCP